MAARGKVADCADGACRQSARCSGLMETGGRSCNGSMLHPKAIARCGSAPEMAPRAEGERRVDTQAKGMARDGAAIC